MAPNDADSLIPEKMLAQMVETQMETSGSSIVLQGSNVQAAVTTDPQRVTCFTF